MYMMSSATDSCRHEPGRVFALWADPKSWPEWDPEVRRVAFDGPMRLGAQGVLWPAKGPKATFTVTALEEGTRLVDVTRLPGATLSFDHRVVATPQGCEVRVCVELAGPAAPVWKRVLGSGLHGAADAGVHGLIAHLDADAAR